jgi:two-component system chemotaxis response regulator CheB
MDAEIVVVGASLGGLTALQILLAGLNADLGVPVGVVLHRSNESGPALRNVLQRYSSLPIWEPHDKETALPGRVYIAPADYHLLIEDGEFSLSVDVPVIYARPSVDVLFESAADSYGAGTVGVVLTGANHDGANGAARIKVYGGVVIIQNPQTAECKQMPTAAMRATSPDYVADLEQISSLLNRLASPSASKAA